ncbi:hypothetical protein GBAR_LOCUS1133 [Geodia barretti]|uniref:AP-5 complex subunit zeta-1 ARM repeats domain-containing protein n=1 Tax=Geodia barretti TaxID=519541 RepID=A0AA35W4F0_GEOBA|nr:hypothetical protein GBAR_LOCUS1133 [Geodia barretti]
MYDIETPIRAYFGQVLTAKFNDLGVAYDTIEFLLGNAEMLMNATNIFSKYVPNLLKVCASYHRFLAVFAISHLHACTLVLLVAPCVCVSLLPRQMETLP